VASACKHAARARTGSKDRGEKKNGCKMLVLQSDFKDPSLKFNVGINMSWYLLALISTDVSRVSYVVISMFLIYLSY